MSARRYGDFIVGMSTSAVVTELTTCENAADLLVVRRERRVLVGVSSERSARCLVRPVGSHSSPTAVSGQREVEVRSIMGRSRAVAPERHAGAATCGR